MNWQILMIMRQEVLLAVLILLQLVLDISESQNRQRSVWFTIGVFAVITASGFLPSDSATFFGSMFISDSLRVMLKNVLSVSTLIVLLQSSSWLMKEENHLKSGAYYISIFSTLLGMNFMISAGNFLILYLGLELSTLPLALLAAFDKKLRRSAEAGLKLLMSSAVSSAVLLFGVSLFYGIYGTLQFNIISSAPVFGSLSIMALTFFLSGLGFKLSLVPFHFWTADVYEGSPMSVTTYFSVVSKGAALFTLMLVLYQVFGKHPEVWSNAVYVLAISTMIVGNLFALRQKNMKRFIAFSSVTQAGFMMLGFINPEALGMTTIIYFMVIYAFSNLAVFGVLSIIYERTRKETMDDYNGLYATNPGLSLILLICLFSLVGIPPVAGFFGKFFLFTAAASKGLYFLVLFAVLNATVSLYYYLLVIKAIFINKNDSPIPALEPTLAERIALAVCIAAVLMIGFLSQVYQHIESVVAIVQSIK